MLLEINNLHAGYGGNEVLRGISLSVNQGEAVCLIGPNGAGKSTILKSIMGLTTKLSGSIMCQGRDITNAVTHGLLAEGIGFVPQGRLVFPTLTVSENLDMGGYLINRRATLLRNKEMVLRFFPALRHRLKAPAGGLSGGEQQMLAIGRALMMTPILLILDEPSLGLSPKITAEVYEKLREIQMAGTALLIVEQNVRVVLRFVARGYLLSNGTIRFAGSAAELGDPRRMHEAYLV